MTFYYTVKCLKCEKSWDIRSDLWEFPCDKCGGLMKKRGGDDYCYCSHQRKRHSRPDTHGCWDCMCMEFIDIHDYIPDEGDAQLFKIKTCKHEYRKDKYEGEKWWYACIHCGARINTKPEDFTGDWKKFKKG